MTGLNLGKINFGKIDAKNELIDGSEREVNEFLECYQIPPGVDVDEFIDGKKYFITGLKGIGKTALLRYVGESTRRKSPNATIEFFLFKSELNEEDRKLFSRAGRVTAIDAKTQEWEKDNNYEPVWRWFLHRTIADKVIRQNVKLFSPSVDLQNYIELMTATYDTDNGNGVRSLLPKLKKGNLEISANPKLGLEFEWANDNTAGVKFFALLEKADFHFEKLIPGSDKLCLFFDELELGIGTSKQRERDAALIGDLVLAIDRMNRKFRTRKHNITVYAAVRSEIRDIIVGKEINKPLADFGAPIQWHQRGGNSERHPLLELVVKRISYSELREGVVTDKTEFDDVWARYFPNDLRGDSSRRYVLHQTWYRPRDLVRLLTGAQKQNKGERQFSQATFDSTKKEYSAECWAEITEELTARYSPEEVEAISLILTAYSKEFSLAQFIERCDKCASTYPDVKKFLLKRQPVELLQDLYRLGVVGNIGGSREREMRWSFRGDQRMVPDQRFIVHNALRAYFSL